MKFSRLFFVALCTSFVFYTFAFAQNQTASLNFAVIGDSGDGSKAQAAIGRRLVETRQRVPFEFVLMLGDNIYGGGKPKYFKPRFEEPYKELLSAGVKFYAAMGNHDASSAADHVKYEHFNMGGKRYYNYVKGDGLIEFFVLDTNEDQGIAAEQVKWLEESLAASTAKWKVAYMHHSLFSSGKMHPPYLKLRNQLHPIFVKHKVNLVLAGHVHVYERIKPQDGVQYITEGCSGKLMRNNLKKPSELTAFGQDQQQSFMTAQVSDGEMKLEAIGLDGKIFDSVTLTRK
jgi:3',5'-cyclic AMP phosphodiesterase CpdA